jgi:general secretion pathway protein I
VSQRRGFTLLEVLVAFAILSLTIVVAVQGFAQGLRLLKLSGDHQQAVLLADQKVREITLPKEGQENGTEGDFTWERSTKAVPAPDLEVPGRPPKWHVYEITVSVGWGEPKRSVSVTTLRTVSDVEEKAPPASSLQGAPLPGGTRR